MSEIQYLEINDVTRIIKVPTNLLLGVMEDKDVERVYFKCKKIVGDNVDLSKHQLYVKYVNALDNSGKNFDVKTPGIYHCEDVVDHGDYITFSWLLSGNVFKKGGFVAFSVLASDGETTRWNTFPAIGTVLITIPGGLQEVEERYPDIITQLLNRMDEVEAMATPEAMQGYVNTYLAAHPAEIDPELLDPKKCAPADVVGQLKKDLVNFEDAISKKYESKNLFNKDSLLIRNEKMVQGSGMYISLTRSSVSHPIKIHANKSYTFAIAPSYYGQNACVVRICDEKGNLDSLDKGTIATNNGDGSATFSFGFDCYVCVNVRDISSMMVVEGTSLPSEYKPYFDPYIKIIEDALPRHVKTVNGIAPDENGNISLDANPLYGKKLALNGDSICYGAGLGGGYGKIIAENNNMIVSNIALTGGTIASGTTYSGGGNRHWICRTIKNMPTDADYYIVEGACNDIALGVPIGTLSSGYISALDDSTFYGAMESTCKQMITKFKGKKYGFIIAHQMKGGIQLSNPKYKAIVECCEKWGVPYLDLAKNCVPFGLFEKDWDNDLSALRNTYTADDGTGYGDGWHPNEEGYKKYYVPKIEAWLRSL